MDLTQYFDAKSGTYNVPYTLKAEDITNPTSTKPDAYQTFSSKYGVASNNVTQYKNDTGQYNFTPGQTFYLSTADKNTASQILADAGGVDTKVQPLFNQGAGANAVIDKPTVTGNAAIDAQNAANFERAASGQTPQYNPSIVPTTPSTPSAGTSGPTSTATGHQNIINPTTGQKGYQVPGTPLPAGWQAIGGSTGAPGANNVSGSPAGSSIQETLASVQASLKSLTDKGYGNTDLSQLPQGTDINNLPANPNGTPTLNSILGGAGVQIPNGASLSDMVKAVADAYGVKSVQDEMKKIDDQYADDVQNIQDDPWISEGIRSKRIQTLKDKYDTKKTALTDRLKLEGDIVGKAIQLYTAEKSDEQQVLLKQMEAQIQEKAGGTPDIKEYNLVKSQGYTGSFADYQKYTANLKNPASGGGSFTNDNVNTGAARAGVPVATFKTYPQDVQNYYINNTAAKVDTINSAIANVRSGDEKASDVKTEIDNSTNTPEVKTFLKKQVDDAAPTDSGGGLWNWLSNLF